MRTLPGLAFLLCGCQLLPSTEVPCASSDRCAPSPEVEMPPPPEVVATPFVLGQPDGETNWYVRGMSNPQGVLIAGNKLFVSDTDNQRVLVWNTLPTTNYQKADLVLGQEQLSTQLGGIYFLQMALVYPTRLASDGTKLAVACDGSSTNRLVFYNTLPTANNARNSFYFDPGYMPGAATARIFSGASPLFAGGHLYLSDRLFHRMLIWDAIPTAPTDATSVIGQSNFTNNTANGGGAIGLGTLNGPEGMPSSDGTRLFLPDTKNHRVLFWNNLPTTNTGADHVLGQLNATAVSINRGGTPGLDTLNSPTSASAAGTRLAIADRGNHRVLLWDPLPTTNGETADYVLGQSTPTGINPNQAGLSGAGMNKPSSVSTDGTHIAVADTDNQRVLLWNSWPTGNGVPADVVLGQPAPNQNFQNARQPSATRFLYPLSVTRAQNRLIVVDRDAHRVLLWPRLPTLPTEEPDIVLGQGDFTLRSSNAGAGTSAQGFDNPHAASSDGTILAVADTDNNRILIWKSIPTMTQQPAELVIGQPSLTSDVYNTGGSTLGLDTPYGVFVRNGRIYVADTDNDRVLIWTKIPTQNHQQADIVLGQADFTGTNANRGSGVVNNLGLSRPTEVYADDSHIYVSDSGNARVLIWNTLDPATGQAASIVLGQPSFSVNTHISPPSAATIGAPGGMDIFKGVLYIPDAEHHRIAVFNTLPTVNGQAASRVLGQPSLTSESPNAGGMSSETLQSSSGILITEVGIYIADAGNHRVTVLPPPSP